MTRRVCLEAGCPTLTTETSRCPTHTRERDKARGTRQERGYDARHDQLRRWWQGRLNKGEAVLCWRCRKRIDPSDWTLGHDDEDRSKYRGPECPACQYATAGRRISPVT